MTNNEKSVEIQRQKANPEIVSQSQSKTQQKKSKVPKKMLVMI